MTSVVLNIRLKHNKCLISAELLKLRVVCSTQQKGFSKIFNTLTTKVPLGLLPKKEEIFQIIYGLTNLSASVW